MAQWFEDLMSGIERNVSSKNKEKFTHNLSSFRRDVVNLPKISNYSTDNSYQIYSENNYSVSLFDVHITA
ncbi:hypothetical protein DOY81_013853 [Sarcophaga bullata]|nr:hypothetical protein DOY81_013853 [Sarcophaga bullata]